MRVRFEKIHDDAVLPVRGTPHSAGYDLHAYLRGRDIQFIPRSGERAMRETVGDSEAYWLLPGHTAVIPTGLKVAMPSDMAMLILPRSGMSLKTSLRIANSPGLVDPDYRGEVGLIAHNTGSEPILVQHGDRIAQALFQRFEVIRPVVVDSLDTTVRADGGFGSTG